MDAQQAFTALGNKVRFYTWPVDKRPIVGSNPARFHAKALVADGATAFITSANLTGATRLYQRAGMYVAGEFALYEKNLRTGEGQSQ